MGVSDGACSFPAAGRGRGRHQADVSKEKTPTKKIHACGPRRVCSSWRILPWDGGWGACDDIQIPPAGGGRWRAIEFIREFLRKTMKIAGAGPPVPVPVPAPVPGADPHYRVRFLGARHGQLFL